MPLFGMPGNSRRKPNSLTQRVTRASAQVLAALFLALATFLCFVSIVAAGVATNIPGQSDSVRLRETLLRFAFLLLALLLQIGGGFILNNLLEGTSARQVAEATATDFGVKPDFSGVPTDHRQAKLKGIGVYTLIFAIFTLVLSVCAVELIIRHR